MPDQDIMIEAVKRLRLQPGEILVIKGFQGTSAQAAAISDAVRASAPGTTVMMLAPGMDIEIVTPCE